MSDLLLNFGTAAQAAGSSLHSVPIEAQLLFIGAIFLGTLIINRFSIRIGIPAILGVLALGLMINIHVLDVSHGEVENLHTFALALLLFYAGLKTDLKSIRGFLEYGLLLAVGGVAICTIVLGFAIYLLSSSTATAIAPGMTETMPLGAAFLIAACLGSTDAGATLSVMRKVRSTVPPKVLQLLEFESALNDPSALIIFSICLSLFVASNNAHNSFPSLALAASSELLQKLGSGLLVGIVFGYISKLTVDSFVTDKEQLLIVAMSIALIDYGSSFFLGGSGFVSVYVTGAFMANLHYQDPKVNHQSIQDVLLPFNTMTEISIFLLFGLLIHPSDLAICIPAGLASATALMLIARPISVVFFQQVSPFNRKESALIAWCGLRGAVPLALSFSVQEAIATYPGLETEAAAQLAQNAQGIIFIVVMINLLVQGISISPLCNALNDPVPPASFD